MTGRRAEILARKEATIRWTARILGSLFVAILLAFLIGESLMPPQDGTQVELSWLDVAGLSLMGLGLFGFVIAWWRPTLGGILGLVGLALPFAQSFLFLDSWMQLWWIVTSPLNLAILAGILHILDGRWRRRGIGPPVGRGRKAIPGNG